MKKILIILFSAFLSFFLFNQTANADTIIYNEDGSIYKVEESPKTAQFTHIWVAYPADYVGTIDVYVHSTLNPEGVSIYNTSYLKMDTYKSSVWNFVCYRVHDLAPSEYWVSLKSSFDTFEGKGYPDTNIRTLLPETNPIYPKIKIEADGDTNEIGSRVYNTNQFFCIYSRTESLDENINNMDSIFENMLHAKIEYAAKAYGTQCLAGNALNIAIPGHYDDYITLFQPYGCPLYSYFTKAMNSPMHKLITGFSEFNGEIFNIENNPDEDSLFYACADNILFQSTLFGWDLVFDTRSLEYEDTSWGQRCITNFHIKEDDTLVNLFIRNLNNAIPDMKELNLPFDINDKNELFEYLKQSQIELFEEPVIIEDLTEEPFVEIDYGEESFNTVPNYEPVPEPEPVITPITPETTSRWKHLIPIAITLLVVVLISFAIFRTNKKQNTRKNKKK